MGEALITRRGGGGGGMSPGNAVIHVNAPVGSTVSFIKNGIVAKVLPASKGHINSDGESEDYYFPVSAGNYGEWTVEAVRGDMSSSHSVTVSEAEQYDVKCLYRLYLYKDGDTFDDVTGGWTRTAGYPVLGSTYIQLESGNYCAISPANKFARGDYTKLSFVFTNTTITAGYTLVAVTEDTRLSFSYLKSSAAAYINHNDAIYSSPEKKSIDLSSLPSTTQYYIALAADSSKYNRFYEVYFEE